MITLKLLRKYFKEELNMEPRHDLKACKRAFNQLNLEIKADELDLIKLIFENKPMEGFHTHSYGFHTANGRYIIDTFKNLYHG